MGDVATVVDGFAEDDRYARFDGRPAVMIRVYRVGDSVGDLGCGILQQVVGTFFRGALFAGFYISSLQ